MPAPEIEQFTIYCIDPKPFVPVGRERWTDRAQRYFRYKADLQALGIQLPDEGASIEFRIAMPKSWPKKKRAMMLGTPHRQRPDLSNLVKAVEDAARYRDGEDDQTIWHYAGISKVWSHEGEILIRCTG